MMNGKYYGLVAALALLGGVIGGVISNWIFIVQPVFAEKVLRPTKIVTSEEFRLVDKDQNIRARIGFAVSSDSGQIPQLMFYGRQGKMMTMVLSGAEGRPSLLFLDKNMKTRVELSLSENGGARLGLFDESQRARAMLAVYEKSRPELSLSQDFGFSGPTVSLTPQQLRINGPGLTTGVSLELSKKDQLPNLFFRDNGGIARTTLNVEGIMLRDKKTQIIWSAP